MNEMNPPHAVPSDLLDGIKAAVGPKGWSDDAARLEPSLVDWRQRYRGRTPLLVRPGSTAI